LTRSRRWTLAQPRVAQMENQILAEAVVPRWDHASAHLRTFEEI
jgi:hypothetical protein